MSGRTLGAELKSRCNNFDFIRLFAAFLVIVSHSYPIAYGAHAPDPLMRITGYTTFGELAVAVFFVISGLLVARSFISEPRPLAYLKKRSLRIFPALIVCTLFCVAVVGPLFTSNHLSDYAGSHQTIRFLRNAILWPTYELPGVFVNHPLIAVNGSLWSLPFEFVMYLVVLCMGLTRTLTRSGVVTLLAAFLVFHVVYIDPGWWETNRIARHEFLFDKTSLFGFLFLAGTALLMFKDRVRLDWRIAAACLAGIVGSCFLPPTWGLLGFCIFLPYLVLYLAFVKAPFLQAFTRHGDFSYGVYLYAFPVQQMVLQITLARNIRLPFSEYVAICCILTLGLGVLSWFLVEKPMLRLKKKSLHDASRDNAACAPAPFVAPDPQVVGAK